MELLSECLALWTLNTIAQIYTCRIGHDVYVYIYIYVYTYMCVLMYKHTLGTHACHISLESMHEYTCICIHRQTTHNTCCDSPSAFQKCMSRTSETHEDGYSSPVTL